MSSIVGMASAPISITYACLAVVYEFDSPLYAYLLFGYLCLMFAVVSMLHFASINIRRRVRTLASQCAQQVDEFAANVRTIRTNALEALMARNLWKLRHEQKKAMSTGHLLESVFDLIFSSPILAGSIVLMAIQRSTIGEQLDAATLYTIIGAMSSLKGILASLSEAVSTYQDYSPAMIQFTSFFEKVRLSRKDLVV